MNENGMPSIHGYFTVVWYEQFRFIYCGPYKGLKSKNKFPFLKHESCNQNLNLNKNLV